MKGLHCAHPKNWSKIDPKGLTGHIILNMIQCNTLTFTLTIPCNTLQYLDNTMTKLSMGLTIPGCSNLWRRWGGSLAAEGDGGLAWK